MRRKQLVVWIVLGTVILSGSVSVLRAAALLIEQKESSNHPHVTVTLLGFSKQKNMAVLQEQTPAGRDNKGTFRQLNIINIVTDKTIVHAEAVIGPEDPRADQRFEELLQNDLADRNIFPVHDVKLEKFPAMIGHETFSVEIGPSKTLPDGTTSHLQDGFETGAGSLEYKVYFKSDLKGSKVIGFMRSVPPSTGQNPISPPVLLGYVHDPYADRVVVVLEQEVTGGDAWTTPIYRFMGARLDRRFSK